MRRQRDSVLSAAFSNRADALKILASVDPVSESGDRLRHAESLLRDTARLLANSQVAPYYARIADLVGAAALLLDWRQAVVTAAAESGRFLVAAQQRAKDVEAAGEAAGIELDPNFQVSLDLLSTISTPDGVSGVMSSVVKIPLPVGIFRETSPSWSGPPDKVEERANPRPEVAIASFLIDGVPVGNPHAVAPHINHDLRVDLRLSAWPDGAEAVRLRYTTVESPGHFEVPEFQFARPSGAPPFHLVDERRIRLPVPQSMSSRPMEFHYSLSFLPADASPQSTLEGQRTLRLEAFDPSSGGITGYRELDRHFLAIRDDVRRVRGPDEEERAALLIVLGRLMQLAAQARQDALLGPMAESGFQDWVRTRLRDDQKIGGELEEHPRAGGGIPDLSFRGVRIELKVEGDRLLGMKDVDEYLPQAAEYVAASSRRLGVLAVLECSPKTEALGATTDDIALRMIGNKSIAVAVVILRGNLPRPSDL